jgi:hypothetical protein
MMINLVLFAFIAYGMTTIMVYGSIFETLRGRIHLWGNNSAIGKFFSDLISCVLCTSTWVGFFLSITMFSPVNGIYSMDLPFATFFDGMFTAGVVWAINSIIEWFEN